MKKLIAILGIAIVLVGAVFAASGDQLIINATVNAVKPAFSIFGAKTLAGAEARPTATTISYSENLADNDIVLYICLYQNNKAKFSGTATLTIKATPLSNTDSNAVGKTTSDLPDVDNLSANTNIAGITYGANAGPSSTKDTTEGKTIVTFAPIYDGRAIQAANIGTFDLTWGQDDDLSVGSYSATVTLTYTPQ